MALKPRQELRKVRCQFSENPAKTYTYLCEQSLFDTLSEGDFVVICSSEYKIVRVINEDVAPLIEGIEYKEILARLETSHAQL